MFARHQSSEGRYRSRLRSTPFWRRQSARRKETRSFRFAGDATPAPHEAPSAPREASPGPLEGSLGPTEESLAVENGPEGVKNAVWGRLCPGAGLGGQGSWVGVQTGGAARSPSALYSLGASSTNGESSSSNGQSGMAKSYRRSKASPAWAAMSLYEHPGSREDSSTTVRSAWASRQC